MKPVVATLLLSVGVAGCGHGPVPVAAVPKPVPPVVIRQTIIRTEAQPELRPGTKAAKALKDFREQERAAKAARGYPDATAQQLRDINESEIKARDATQHLINKDGHSTQQDQDSAHDSIDALRKAQQAPRETPP
jgi:hypothetical protein